MRMFITRFVASGVYCVSTSRGSLGWLWMWVLFRWQSRLADDSGVTLVVMVWDMSDYIASM